MWNKLGGNVYNINNSQKITINNMQITPINKKQKA